MLTADSDIIYYFKMWIGLVSYFHISKDEYSHDVSLQLVIYTSVNITVCL